LPHEQTPNPYITRELCFEFHYFFMRKLWFAHLARALVVFPGGFGTMDEMTELSYWNEIVNFEALVRYGVVSREELGLIEFVDTSQAAFEQLTAALFRGELAMEGHDGARASDVSSSRGPDSGAAAVRAGRSGVEGAEAGDGVDAERSAEHLAGTSTPSEPRGGERPRPTVDGACPTFARSRTFREGREP
jgi:hypothetical protein